MTGYQLRGFALRSGAPVIFDGATALEEVRGFYRVPDAAAGESVDCRRDCPLRALVTQWSPRRELSASVPAVIEAYLAALAGAMIGAIVADDERAQGALGTLIPGIGYILDGPRYGADNVVSRLQERLEDMRREMMRLSVEVERSAATERMMPWMERVPNVQKAHDWRHGPALDVTFQIEDGTEKGRIFAPWCGPDEWGAAYDAIVDGIARSLAVRDVRLARVPAAEMRGPELADWLWHNVTLSRYERWILDWARDRSSHVPLAIQDAAVHYRRAARVIVRPWTHVPSRSAT